jgi:hypothetical protein
MVNQFTTTSTFMNNLLKKTLQLFFIITYSATLYGQANADTFISHDMAMELKNDTLYFGTGLKLFTGQKLVIGNASGGAGTYRSIISKKAAIVPSIWGQDKRFENAIENYVDSEKNKEKVKKALIPGNILTIKKISLSKTAKPYFYLVSLSSDTDGYNCDIKLALTLGEILLE